MQQAAVLLREDTPGDKRLVAYLVAAPGQTLDTATVKTWLKDQLPDYMVPSAFVVLERLPLTPSGKVARRLLPVPDYADTVQAYVAPRTPVEDTLVQIWAAVLNRAAGRHPRRLLRTRRPLAARHPAHLESQGYPRRRTAADHAVQPPERRRFRGRRAAAQRLKRRSPPSPPCDRSQPLPLSFAQQRLWFLDQLEPGNPVYNVPWAMRLHGSAEYARIAGSDR